MLNVGIHFHINALDDYPCRFDDLIKGVLEAVFLDIEEACVSILHKYERLFILALLYKQEEKRLII